MHKRNLSLICCFGLLMTVIQAKPKKTCLEQASDILFLLDSSNSIWLVDYKKQLQFVSDIVDSFELEQGKSRVRVGVITFSDEAFLEFPLDHYSNPDEMKEAISNIPYRTGNTNTADALKTARSQVERKIEDNNGTMVAIVITDGKSSNPQATVEEAKKLHQLGMRVYAIGVGGRDNYDINELKSIASDPVNGVYTVASYSALKEITEKFYAHLCEDQFTTSKYTTTPEVVSTTETESITSEPSTTTIKTSINTLLSETAEPSEKPISTNSNHPQKDDNKDSTIIFGYDFMSMGSIRINMISRFINTILPYSGYTNFGILSYAYCPDYLNVPVTTLRNKKSSDLRNRINVNASMPGLTEIVRQIRSQMYTSAIRYIHSGRRVYQVAVLFIDPGVNVITRELIEETSKLKRQGVKLFLINVGHKIWPQPQYINYISSQPRVNYIYSYPTYELLLYRARQNPFHFKAMYSPYTTNIRLA